LKKEFELRDFIKENVLNKNIIKNTVMDSFFDELFTKNISEIVETINEFLTNTGEGLNSINSIEYFSEIKNVL